MHQHRCRRDHIWTRPSPQTKPALGHGGGHGRGHGSGHGRCHGRGRGHGRGHSRGHGRGHGWSPGSHRAVTCACGGILAGRSGSGTRIDSDRLAPPAQAAAARPSESCGGGASRGPAGVLRQRAVPAAGPGWRSLARPCVRIQSQFHVEWGTLTEHNYRVTGVHSNVYNSPYFRSCNAVNAKVHSLQNTQKSADNKKYEQYIVHSRC